MARQWPQGAEECRFLIQRVIVVPHQGKACEDTRPGLRVIGFRRRRDLLLDGVGRCGRNSDVSYGLSYTGSYG